MGLPSISRLFVVGSIGSVLACTSNQERFSNSVEITATDGIGEVIEAQAQQGLSAKIDNGYSLEWFSCTRSVKSPYVVMFNKKGEAFDAKACKVGLVQAFLQQDFNVIAVNRPGAGKSEGTEILGDDKTLASTDALLKAQLESGKTISGIWGFEDSSPLAFRLAQSSPFKYVIVGNGLYDWEATLAESKDADFVRELKGLAKDQEPTFVEKRSIAWDFGSLPKSVYLYHLESEARYPVSQAEAFRNALAANQYQVQFIKLRSETQTLTPLVHQSAIIQIAQAIKASEPNK